MRKSILLLAGVGVGAGFLYGFKRSRGDGNGKTVTDGAESRTEQIAKTKGNGKSAGERPTSPGGAREGAGASMGRLENGVAVDLTAPEMDDRGTDQHEASEILKSVRDAAFDASDEKLALALGRPVEEIEGFTSGSETIDGDAVMKARTLAMQRGVEIQ